MWMIGRGLRAMGRCMGAAGQAAAAIWEEIGSRGYKGSSEEALEEFEVQSDGGFQVTESVKAEGKGDVWCVATVTAAAPAGMAGAAIFQVLRTMLGPRWGLT